MLKLCLRMIKRTARNKFYRRFTSSSYILIQFVGLIAGSTKNDSIHGTATNEMNGEFILISENYHPLLLADFQAFEPIFHKINSNKGRTLA